MCVCPIVIIDCIVQHWIYALSQTLINQISWKVFNILRFKNLIYTYCFQVQFNAYLRMPSMFAAVMTAFVGIVFGVMASFSIGRSLLEKVSASILLKY